MRTRKLIVALALVFGCSHGAAPAAPAAPAAMMPAPSTAVGVGARAPGGQLTRSSGEKIALADVVHAHARTIVVFYRGFW